MHECRRSETQSEVRDEPASRDDFTIGIICALPLEAGAVLRVFDKTWKATKYGKRRGDTNQYSLGSLGPHNAVLVHTPKDIEPIEVAAMASACHLSFPNIELVLVVGACGGMPTSTSTDEGVLLGDVVISTNILEYEVVYNANGGGDDQGQNDYSLKTDIVSYRQPPLELRNLLAKLEVEEYRENLQDDMAGVLSRLQGNKAPYPLASEDRCFETGYLHKHNDKNTCVTCIEEMGGRICEETSRLSCVELSCSEDGHAPLGPSGDENKPVVHLGAIVTGGEGPRSSFKRDKVTRGRGAVVFDTGFATSVWNSFHRVMVIMGVYHYSDGHRHEMEAWRRYAAAAAASCAKAVLVEHWVREDGEPENFGRGDTGPEPGALSGGRTRI